MKLKLLNLLIVISFTFTLAAQQVYYTVPGPNANDGSITDFVTEGQTLYLGVTSYTTTGSFPVRQGILVIDTSQSTVVVNEVTMNSSPSLVTLSNSTDLIRFSGSSGSNNDFYDIDLTQPMPSTPTIATGISLSGFQAHTFYQNDFIYASRIGNTTNIEIFLPLQTLTTTSTVWDMETVGDTLYYIGGDNENLYAVDLTSASAVPQIIHTDVEDMVALEITPNYIYYGTFQGGNIKRLEIATSIVTTMATIPQVSNPSLNHARAIEIIGNQVFYAPQRGDLYVLTDNVLSTNSFKEITMKLYPNPATSIIQIESISNIDSVQIFSVLGNQIKTIKNSKTIDVSDLKPGVYFTKINSENRSVTKRFIKQ